MRLHYRNILAYAYINLLSADGPNFRPTVFQLTFHIEEKELKQSDCMYE